MLGAKLLAALPLLAATDAEVDALYRSAMPDLLAATRAEFNGWLLYLDADALAQLDADAAAVSAGDAATYNGVWELDAATGVVRQPPNAAPRYAVLWAHLPWNLRFQNVLALETAARMAALDAVVATQQPAVTGLLPHLCSDAPGSDAPGTIVYAPIWPHHSAGTLLRNTTVTQRVMARTPHAFSAFGFHWRRMLNEALAHRITGVVVVLHAPAAQPLAAGHHAHGRSSSAHTFRNDNGAFVSVAPGDRSAELVPPRLQRFGRTALFGAGWSVTVYPLPALYDLHVTPAPRNNALLVGGLLLLCALLFLFYELIVRKRAARLNAALRANLGEVTRMQRAVAEGYRREAQAEARLLAEEAASAAKEAFVAMVSHEIRTPLNGVSGAASLLLLTRPLSGEQRELLDLLQAGATQVVLIVEDILLHGALASGHFPVDLAPMHLASVLDPCLHLMRLQAAKTGRAHVRLTCAVDARVPPVLSGDASRLVQVLTNLISNSLKFCGDAGGAINLLVDVCAAASDDEAALPSQLLRFIVTDTGCGIAPAHLGRIFEPFRQETESTVRQYGGTGLGLTVRFCCVRCAYAAYARAARQCSC